MARFILLQAVNGWRMDRKRLQVDIATILKSSFRPLTSEEISEVYRRQSGSTPVTSREIDSVLALDLQGAVERDASLGWSIKEPLPKSPRQKRKAPGQHFEEAKTLSEVVGGTDDDVKQYFFALPETELETVLDEYARCYGSAKRKYAEKAIPEWRTGRRSMSGQVVERLFNLLPPRMPIAVRFEMVQTIWERHCPTSEEVFVIGPDCDPESAIEEVERHLANVIARQKIPEAVEKRFLWLSAGDAAVRQHLMKNVLDEERKLIAADAAVRARIIFEHFERQDGWATSVKQVYEIGKHRLEIEFNSRANGVCKGRPMERIDQPGDCRKQTVSNENVSCDREWEVSVVAFAVVAGALAGIVVNLLGR